MRQLAWTGLLILGVAALPVTWAAVLVPGGPPATSGFLIMPIPFLVVGAVVYARRPESLVVRRLMAVCAFVPMAVAAAALLERVAGNTDGGLAWAVVMAQHATVVGFGLAIVGLLAIFPTGTYETPFERAIVRLAALSLLLIPLVALVNDPLPAPRSRRSPPSSPRRSRRSCCSSCPPSCWWCCATGGPIRSDAGRCAGPFSPCSLLPRCGWSTRSRPRAG